MKNKIIKATRIALAIILFTIVFMVAILLTLPFILLVFFYKLFFARSRSRLKKESKENDDLFYSTTQSQEDMD